MKFMPKALALALAMTATQAYAATNITFWHSMEGNLGQTVQQLVDEFNNSQSNYKVNAIYKGSYQESMNQAVSAYRAGKSPDIVQIFEVGSATMMYAKGAVKPIQQMSEEVGNPIDPKKFVGGIAGYYSTADGKLAAMPFNSSTPVLYINKDLFAKAGLDANNPPKTFQAIHEAGKKLRSAGVECAYTTSWPSWVFMENFGAYHNIPYATRNNGFDGLDARVDFTKPAFQTHFNLLNNMVKEGTFTYGGRKSDANALFSSGKCAMITASSGSRTGFFRDAKFQVGMGALPYNADLVSKPQNSVIGGASLWVFNKKSKEVYKGITAFFHFLSREDKAAFWHQATGYVPVVSSAYELTKASGFYEKNAGADIAFKQLNVATTDASRGVRLGFLPQIRDIQEAEMENIFSQKTTVKKGLSEITKRANDQLARFEKINN